MQPLTWHEAPFEKNYYPVLSSMLAILLKSRVTYSGIVTVEENIYSMMYSRSMASTVLQIKPHGNRQGCQSCQTEGKHERTITDNRYRRKKLTI
jgi:hypothetical protein